MLNNIPTREEVIRVRFLLRLEQALGQHLARADSDSYENRLVAVAMGRLMSEMYGDHILTPLTDLVEGK